MYAVSVELTVKPGGMDDFLPLMLENAAASLREEPGCVQFDVCRVEGAPDVVVLYELYVDADAFAAHLQTEHFARFDSASAPLLDEKTVRTGPRILPCP